MPLFTPRNQDTKISSIVTNMVSSFGDAQVPDDYEPLPVKVAEEIRGYDKDDFINDFYKFITEYQKRTNSFKNFSFNVNFADVVPGQDETNSIRYRIIDRQYAGTEPGKGYGQGRKDPRWRLRDILEDSKYPGYSVLIYLKEFDNLISFTSWSKNYRDADLGADKLEDMMETYGSVFKLRGLKDIRFENRDSDIFHDRENHSWYGCPLIYRIKTYKVKLVYEKQLEDIALEITTNIN